MQSGWTSLVPLSLTAVLVSSAMLSPTYNYKQIEDQELKHIFGAACNHMEPQKICHTGTQACGGDCGDGTDVNDKCAPSGATQEHATSGSVYKCVLVGQEDQTHCIHVTGNPQQSCTVDKDCVCKRKVTVPFNKYCKSVTLASPGTTTLGNYQSSSVCP